MVQNYQGIKSFPGSIQLVRLIGLDDLHHPKRGLLLTSFPGNSTIVMLVVWY